MSIIEGMTMLARWRAARLIVPALMTIALLPVLIGLGVWQWQRLAWKEDLIAKIAARSTADPVGYADALQRATTPGEAEYLHVRVTGIFDHAQERHVYAPRNSGPGWHVYTLFWPERGARLLFVNRGWVPDALKDPAKRAAGQIAGTVTVTGLARAAEIKSVFTPENNFAGNQWFSRDLDAMRWGASGPPTAEQLATMRLDAYAPFSIDADALLENAGGWPKGGVTEIRLSNPHLQYVVTWFGLALTLIGVFIAFARQRLAALGEPPLLSR